MPQVDRLEKVFQAPRRITRKLFGTPVPTSESETEQREHAIALASQYLSDNGMDDVRIDVRVYDPGLQWRRLQANSEVSPVWKYTGGVFHWLQYTAIPLRALQTDRFDPFTRTLHLNSTQPLQALVESASAKEYRKRRFIGDLELGRGTYAMLQNIPFSPLLHEVRAGSDALTYANLHLSDDEESRLYPAVYSRLGVTTVSEVLSVGTLAPDAPIYAGPLLRVAGRVTGELSGRAIANETVPSDEGERARSERSR